jgi:glycosyltransferase involved in cell wall biosynthesis
MDNKPLITIGITCYNAADTIAKALKSAQVQSWPVKEIIVVDDCSTDGTVKILQGLDQNPHIRIFFSEKNKGVAASRNRIIKEAKGEFIAFFDDDDESAPDRLECQYTRITEFERFADGAAVLCHTARIQRYPDGTKRYEPTMGTEQGRSVPHGMDVAERILTGKPVPGIFGSTATCSQMARTSLYRGLAGFDEAFRRSEDTDFNIRAALAGAHFAGISNPLVTQTMTMAHDKKLDEERACAFQLLEKHRDFIEQKSSYSFCHDWIDAKYDFLAQQKVKFLLKLLKLFILHPFETVKRIYWAMPNIGFNVRFGKFHHEKE